MVWKPSPVQVLAMVAASSGSIFGSMAVEAAVSSLDWPWYIHAGISLGSFVVVYGCVVVQNRKQRRHQKDEQLAKVPLRPSLYEQQKAKARDIGIQYYWNRYPWWKRVWMRLRK